MFTQPLWLAISRTGSIMGDTGAVSVAERAFHRWEAHGIDCALACGGMGVCGYTWLPAGTGLRRSADVLGYEGIPVDVHGGLTYGPDDAGWIGFDTGHAWDLWTIEELSKVPAGAVGR